MFDLNFRVEVKLPENFLDLSSNVTLKKPSHGVTILTKLKASLKRWLQEKMAAQEDPDDELYSSPRFVQVHAFFKSTPCSSPRLLVFKSMPVVQKIPGY